MFVVDLQIRMAFLVVIFLLLVGTKLRPMKSTPISSQNLAVFAVRTPQIFNFLGMSWEIFVPCMSEVPTKTALMFFGRDCMSFFE